MSAYFWLIPTILAILIIIRRSELLGRMLWAGTLALPVLLLPTIIFSQLQTFPPDLISFSGLFERIWTSFTFGAVAAGVYEMIFKKHFHTKHQGHRVRFFWLLIGPAVVATGILLDRNLALTLSVGLLVDVIILLMLRADLIEDALISATAMGLLYVLLFVINYHDFSGEGSYWFGNEISGIVFFGLPIEELILVTLFGGLWGPIYVAIKDLSVKT